MAKFMGHDFIWFTGVVEDRIDPLMLGRCKVRCLGWHPEDKGLVPTSALPWAHPMAPITSASMSGIGDSPIGPVEGTWVVGFFRDGKEAQDPIIMGTVGGIPEEEDGAGRGFFDPNGAYPVKYNEPDTNRLARTHETEDAESLVDKRMGKLDNMPKAVAPSANTVIARNSDASLYTRSTWNEPNPKYGGPTAGTWKDDDTVQTTYPFNHVHMSESGHVFEVDDTPSSERLHKYHTSGTFEEIQATGDRVVKVVGDDYAITVGEKDVYIQGDCNITVVGNCKTYVQGDMVTEVDGNYYLNVKKDMVTKVGGTQAIEVLGDRSENISGNQTERVQLDKTEVTNGNFVENVGKTHKETIKGHKTNVNQSDYNTTTSGNTAIMTAGHTNIGTGQVMGIAAGGNMMIKTDFEYRRESGTKSIVKHGGESHEKYSGDKYEHLGAVDTWTFSDVGNDVSQTESRTRTSSTANNEFKTEEP